MSPSKTLPSPFSIFAFPLVSALALLGILASTPAAFAEAPAVARSIELAEALKGAGLNAVAGSAGDLYWVAVTSPYCDKGHYQINLSSAGAYDNTLTGWEAADGTSSVDSAMTTDTPIANAMFSIPILGQALAVGASAAECLRGTGICEFLKLPKSRRIALTETRNYLRGATEQFSRGDKARAVDTARQIAGICQGKRPKMYYAPSDPSSGTAQTSARLDVGDKGETALAQTQITVSPTNAGEGAGAGSANLKK
jgi:hypothetical protein